MKIGDKIKSYSFHMDKDSYVIGTVKGIDEDYVYYVGTSEVLDGEVIWEGEERNMTAPAPGEMILDKYFNRFEVIN